MTGTFCARQFRMAIAFGYRQFRVTIAEGLSQQKRCLKRVPESLLIFILASGERRKILERLFFFISF